MKKIGLCICYSVKNYGSMLQAYATQQYIKKSGFDYEIIRYIKKHDAKFYFMSLIKLLNSNFRKEVFRQIAYKISIRNNLEFKENLTIRNSKFTEFEKKYFDKIKSGEKIYEVRLNDEKRQLLKVGDCLFFKREPECIEDLHTHIVELKYYKSFVDLLNDIPISAIGFLDMSNVDVLKEYYKFYTPEDEHKFGVVAIKVEL